MLCTLAALDQGSERYRTAFIWVFWVIVHEVMHMVRERVRTSNTLCSLPPIHFIIGVRSPFE